MGGEKIWILQTEVLVKLAPQVHFDVASTKEDVYAAQSTENRSGNGVQHHGVGQTPQVIDRLTGPYPVNRDTH